MLINYTYIHLKFTYAHIYISLSLLQFYELTQLYKLIGRTGLKYK